MMIPSDEHLQNRLQKLLKLFSKTDFPVAVGTLSAALILILLHGVTTKEEAKQILADIYKRGVLDLDNNWDKARN